MVFSNNNNTSVTAARWKEDDSSKWTEVVSKKKQYQQQQQQQQQQQIEGRGGADDPFAGMKSCVDYEQEIERLKQLVPKVSIDSQHKKRPSLEKKFNTNNTTTIITSNTTTTTSNHTNNNYNFYNNEFINTNNTTSTITSPTTTTPTTSTISRSNSPDTTHSSDSDVSSLLSDQIVTEEEKLRFLAFVRSWTGDWRKGAMMDDLTSSSNSLWADQSPWSRRHNVQSQQYYSYQQPTTMLNKHGQQPIGMGRKNHHQSFGYAL
ncbi:hypothetical protein INT46_006524 [Mucor plumbeus]|uniref:Uncharacterized protein n=1 Tax=Mucor plumbeus TaxID=97098 RepID=A0A8H7VG21_9FUNG|nr:hypothetical protein INT46_006524 [Mucor plumbeus]